MFAREESENRVSGYTIVQQIWEDRDPGYMISDSSRAKTLPDFLAPLAPAPEIMDARACSFWSEIVYPGTRTRGGGRFPPDNMFSSFVKLGVTPDITRDCVLRLQIASQ